MELSIIGKDRALEIQLKGVLDHHGAKGLLTQMDLAIERYVPRVLTMDFGGVTFMDSSGIAVVLRGWQRMRELGGQMHLTHVAAQPRKVFEAAGVGRMMTINAGEETDYAAH